MGNRITADQWLAAGKQAAEEIRAEGGADADRRADIAAALAAETAKQAAK